MTGSIDGRKTSRGRPRGSDHERRRQEIIGAAARIFAAEGVGFASMDDIANEVGLAKASLYHYFRNKDEIFFAIHEATMGYLSSRLEYRAETGATTADRLHGIFIDTFTLNDELPGYSQVVMEQLRQLPPAWFARVVENQEAYTSAIRRIFEEGMLRGEIRPGDPHQYTLALLGMANWSYRWYSPTGPHTPMELANRFFDIFVHGVDTDPPRANESSCETTNPG